MNEILNRGKRLLTQPQSTVFSAATIIMVMVIASRILGLVRQRVLAHFFAPAELSLFFAAFRLPDLIFEVLVFGTFSSAFIPIFSKALKNGERGAWEIAGRVLNLGLVACTLLAIIIGIWADKIYGVVAPGFSPSEIAQIANLARVLFVAQVFFVASYVLTGVLESMKRFIIPGLAPIFYNLGIIVGTVVFTNRFGLFAPALGVILGAACHFLVQLPAAIKLGFKFVSGIKPTPGVVSLGKLAAPRLIDLSFQQIASTSELFFSSLISTSAYTYFTFASSLQLLPLNLFGTSLAKAALPTLTHLDNDIVEFKRVLLKTLYQMFFLIMPVITLFIVLRIPLIRLIFGTSSFDWEATVQTGMVLSAFALGVPFRAAIALLSRGFYALHNTKTPVVISLVGDGVMITMNVILILKYAFPVWALAASYSVAGLLETLILIWFLDKRLGGKSLFLKLGPLAKSVFASLVSGLTMFFLLKFLDRYAWVKHLSFIGKIDAGNIAFEKFVLDTQYTFDLLLLTSLVALVGGVTYLVVSKLVKSDELEYVSQLVFTRLRLTNPNREGETIVPPPNDTTAT